MITKLNIPCVWGGHLAGILLKNHATTPLKETTKKIIGIHGWLDNLNSLLPIAEKLIDRHPNYEIYLYDRAGHGFSSHLPKGSDYSYSYNLRDLRIVTQTLGWNKEKYSFIGHSFGASLAMTYAAAYPEEISCLVALDSIIEAEKSSKSFWKIAATRTDNNLQYYSKSPKIHKSELTYEKAIELVRSSRIGINDEAAKLLVQRSIRLDKHNKLHFTRDESLRHVSKLPLMPFSQGMAEEAIKHIQASVLFIGTVNPQWPISKTLLQLLKEHNPNFETCLIDGSHHFHMTHVDERLLMVKTELNIPCIWGGTLTGLLLKNDLATTNRFGEMTTKIIGIHGWLDNLNSLLPLTENLIERHPNYEIYVYDRAGHGFSGHLPKGVDYSLAQNLQDLRIVIQTLGWNKGKFSIIAHSYGAVIGMTYAASYPEEVECLVSIDALPRIETSSETFYKVHGSRIDTNIKFHNTPRRNPHVDLTYEKALELTKVTRSPISDEAAQLLTERSVRKDKDNKWHFTRDESLKIPTIAPFTDDMLRSAVAAIQASVLFIGTVHPQWPRAEKSIELLQEYNPNFEMTLIDGPHHIHMTHVDEVADRIEQYFDRYSEQPSIPKFMTLNN